MDYHVAKSKDGGFIGARSQEEIVKAFRNGELQGDYVVTRSFGQSYNDLLRSGIADWITVAELVANGPPESSATNQAYGSALDVLTRYQDGYRVANLINGFGQTCKVVGVCFGGLIFLGSAMAESISSFAIVIGLVVGSIVGFVGWANGVLISAQGHLVKATLDTAVNSSPFLSNEGRAKVMSLR